MENSNELRSEAVKGNVREGFELLKREWAPEVGERIVAEVGKDQEATFKVDMKGREVEIKRKGWKDILAATGLGHWEGDGLEAFILMVDGGRNAVGKMEGVTLAVELVKDGVKVGNLVVRDDEVMTFDGKENPELEVLVKQLEEFTTLKYHPNDARVETVKRKMSQLPGWTERRRKTVKSAFDKLDDVLGSVRFEEKKSMEVVVGQN